MRALRFRTKIAIAFLATVALALVVAFVDFRYEFRQTLIRNERPHLRREARRVGRRFARDGAPFLEAWQARQPEPGSRGFWMYSTDGTLLASSPPAVLPPPAVAELVARCLDPGVRESAETVTLADGREARALAELVVPRGAADGLVAVTFLPLTAIEAQTDSEMKEALARALPVALLVALASAWVVARSLARPLARISREAEEASALESGARVAGTGAGDELDVLCRVLNDSFARLRQSAERQSRFTSDAAHELRTPVASILGRADVVLRNERTAAEYRAALEDVRTVASRAARTVESLLHLARLDAGDGVAAEDVDLGAVLVREASAACRAHGLPEDAATVELAAGDAHLTGDGVLLTLLVRNLVDNALTHGRSARGVALRLRRDGGDLVLAVHDHGAGIPPEHVDDVFARLHRVDVARTRALGGAGLGLSIVRSVAEAHGGEATLTSSVGAGTTVTVRLPAGHGSGAAADGVRVPDGRSS